MTASTTRHFSSARRGLALALAYLTAMATGWAQQQQMISPVRPQTNIFLRPYESEAIPPIRLGNSNRLRDLVRAGKLYLTVQDAIALALENNIDVEFNRYNALIAASNLRRYEAGGALPGVPSGFSQANTAVSGQGVAGSQVAAGVGSGGGNNGSGNTVGATISQIGPTTPNLDPVVQQTVSFSHLSQPQANVTQTEVANYIQNLRRYGTTFRQGFLTGGNLTVSFLDSYSNENVPSNLLNPTTATVLQLQFQQNLLQGFGTALNSRNIVVNRANVRINDLNFQTEVIATVVNVLDLYYGLVADYEDVKAKQSALDVAQKLFEDNQKQLRLGTMTPLDVTIAESQVAASQRELVTAQGTLEQQQTSLKNVLSRTGLADPVIRDVQIVPLDRIDVPQEDKLPPLKNLIATALEKRVDLVAERMNLENSRVSATGTQNGVLPQLALLAGASGQGLAGTPQSVPVRQGQVPGGAEGVIPPGFAPCPPSAGGPGITCQVPDSYFVGGVGTALGQMIRRNFPSQNVGAFLAARLQNRQAQADYAIDQLSIRQQALQNNKHLNQIAVDVSNQVVALQQARARYQAAVKNRVLQEQLLQAEQKKFALGASTTYQVVQQQRDLATAQSSEITALVTYSNARISLDQTLGTTLETNHVSLGDAVSGRIGRVSSLPAAVPNEPSIPARPQ